jgi:GT2 family glycosyltransferase
VAHTLTVVNVEASRDDIRVTRSLEDCPAVSVLNLTTNVGYAGACNAAATIGDCEVIALFNADTELRPGVVDRCYELLMQNADWGVVGPKQVSLEGKITHGGIFGTLDAPKHRGWHEQDRGQYRDVEEAVTVAGSAYFIKRTVWDELTACPLYQDVAPHAAGAFLPTKHYYEETFASYHAQAHGHKVVYVGDTSMIHAWHKASPVGGASDQQMPESRRYFRLACDHHDIAHD